MCVSKAFLMKVSSDKLNLQIKKITTDYKEKWQYHLVKNKWIVLKK